MNWCKENHLSLFRFKATIYWITEQREHIVQFAELTRRFGVQIQKDESILYICIFIQKIQLQMFFYLVLSTLLIKYVCCVLFFETSSDSSNSLRGSLGQALALSSHKGGNAACMPRTGTSTKQVYLLE